MSATRTTAIILALLLGSLLLGAQGLAIYTEQNMPFSGADKDGNLVGFSVEVVREIQRRIGNSDPIHLVPWARGLLETEKGTNGVLFSTSRNAERDPLFQWVGPLVEYGGAFFSLADSPLVVKSLEDARKVGRIAVVIDDARDVYLRNAGFTNLDRGRDFANAYAKLISRRVDLVAGNSAAAQTLFLEAGGKPGGLKQQLVFNRAQLWIAFSKDVGTSVVKAWADAFESMRKDGSFEALHRKWLPGVPLPGPPITKFQ